jgi:hypothetical protein
MYKSLSKLSGCALLSVRPTLASQSIRWQHAEALRREIRPIHEHKSLPDGMEGLIDGIDDLNVGLLDVTITID